LAVFVCEGQMTDQVTIGMTCYNAQETVEDAVMSALNQDYPNFEIIIVDDCSTDESWGILLRVVHQHPDKIRIFRNEKNLGVAGARNRIISEARGEFLCFFDDDDVSLTDRLTRQVQRIVDYERDFAVGAPVICHTARVQKYPDGSERVAPTMGCDEGVVAPHGADMAARILYNKKIQGGDGAMPTCSQMARLSTYKMLGGFDETFRRMEDTEFNLNLALAGGNFVGIQEPLVVQTMTTASDKQIADERIYARQMYKKHKAFLLSAGRGKFDIDWLEAKHDYWEGARLRFITRLMCLFCLHPLLSIERVMNALPNMGYNMALRHFHRKNDS
jgi:glycosyltransferase involved in cell wall biosynthesis